MARLIWTEEARFWLREIHAFIAQDSDEAALRVLKGILERARMLREFPDMGQVYRWHGYRGVRMLLYGHYRILYLHRDDEVFVLGVFHGAMDLRRHLKARLP